MKFPAAAKQFSLVFVVTLIGYVIFYYAIEHHRTRNGPWQITFTNDSSGAPSLIINQPRLAITNLCITFSNATTSTTNLGTLMIEQPHATPFELPFGKCVFMDTTSLPGTIVFQVFGHEIQLMPRVLTIDKKEIPWRSSAVIPLPGL